MLVGRATVLGALFATVLLATAPPAWAHAELESTSPSPSSVLLETPRQVVLRFDEAVTIDFGSMSVLALDGRRVDEGGARHPGGEGSVVATSLAGPLPKGTYVVAWRVVSDDGHPVHGAYVFSVGSAAGIGRAERVATSLAAEGGSTAVGAVYGVLRAVVFAALLLLVGAGAALLLAPWLLALRRVRRLLWTAWATLGVATVLGIGVQGAYAAALPLSHAASPSSVRAVLHTRFGEVQLLRLVLLAGVAVVLRGLGRPGPAGRRWRLAVGIPLALGLLLTPGLAGHASTLGNGVVGETIDVVHLAAASLWVGGLALLGVLVLHGQTRRERAGETAALARRFSVVAASSVVVLVTSGTLQSLRRVGSTYALFHTSYGRILLVKIGLLAGLVAVAAITRRRVVGGWISSGRRLRAVDGRATPPPVALAGELALLAAIVVATSLLVNTVPARQAAAQPFTASFDVLGLQLNAVVAPAQVGPQNQFHFYVLGSLGQPVAVRELDASIALPGRAPRALTLVVAGPGHYQANTVDLPVAGSWSLTVTMATSPGTERRLHAVIPVH